MGPAPPRRHTVWLRYRPGRFDRGPPVIDLKLCSSTEWADAVQHFVIPWSLEDVELGGHFFEIDPDTLSERLTRAGFDRTEVTTNEYGIRARAWAPVR